MRREERDRQRESLGQEQGEEEEEVCFLNQDISEDRIRKRERERMISVAQLRMRG